MLWLTPDLRGDLTRFDSAGCARPLHRAVTRCCRAAAAAIWRALTMGRLLGLVFWRLVYIYQYIKADLMLGG